MVSFETALVALALLGNAPGETVLLDFYADWCIPCRQMDAAVHELAARGYPVRKVNVEREPALAAKFGVRNVPCFVMLVDGQAVDRVVGGTTFSRLERMCQMGQAARRSAPAAEPPQPAGTSREPGAFSVPIPEARATPALPGPAGEPRRDPRASRPADRVLPVGWQLAGPGPLVGGAERDRRADHLIAATVRLRIEDPDGHSCGSGTIIDARDGEALILTCGHIFRDSDGRGRIEVDLFGPAPAERLPGRLLGYDLERDIGLLTVETPGPVDTARVAPPGHHVAKSDRVVSVGCNNGEPPSARRSRVTSIDKYLGPPNLQVAGLPVQGRSGGGLFSEDGLLIGVCTAADPKDEEGLYTALAAIHSMMDEAELAFVYRSGGGRAPGEASLAAHDPPDIPKRMPRPSDLVPVADVSAAQHDGRDAQPAAGPGGLTAEEQAALEEIRRRRQQGAEVVCVIRSRSDPQAPSEIIVLDRVSTAFVERLVGESSADGSPQRQFTSYDVPQNAAALPGPSAVATRGPSSSQPLLEYRATAAGSTSGSGRTLPERSY